MGTAMAQAQLKKTAQQPKIEEEGPLVLKFEPGLDVTANRKRDLFKLERRTIDTMQVSDRKKQRLLKKLHNAIYNGTFDKKRTTNTTLDNDVNP
jgi:hypothetical protein